MEEGEGEAVAALVDGEQARKRRRVEPQFVSKLHLVATRAEGLVQAMCDAEKRVVASRKRVAASANAAIDQINRFFLEVVRGQRDAQLAALHHTKKRYTHGPSDVVAAQRALRHVLLAGERGVVRGLEQGVGAVVAQHTPVGCGGRVWVGVSGLEASTWKTRFTVDVDGETMFRVWRVSPAVFASLNHPRTAFGGTAAPDGTLIAVGGTTPLNGPIATLETVHARSRDREWSVAQSNMPCCNLEFGACVVGSELVMVGGSPQRFPLWVWGTPRQPPPPRTAVWAFHLHEHAWRQLTPLPHETVAPGVVAFVGKVFVIGGNCRGERLPDVLSLNLRAGASEWERLPPLLQARQELGAAAGSNRLFACGGANAREYLDSCETFSLRQSRWTALPPLPSKRGNAGCCYGGGNVFVVGGTDGRQALRETCVLSVAHHNNAWTVLAPLGVPREGCHAACVGRRLVVFGGQGERAWRACEVFAFE